MVAASRVPDRHTESNCRPGYNLKRSDCQEELYVRLGSDDPISGESEAKEQLSTDDDSQQHSKAASWKECVQGRKRSIQRC